jgi:hypothetical protein
MRHEERDTITHESWRVGTSLLLFFNTLFLSGYNSAGVPTGVTLLDHYRLHYSTSRGGLRPVVVRVSESGAWSQLVDL